MADSPFFLTRGVVIGVHDMQTLDWPQRAKDAGLSTIATHVFPQEVADFMATDAGQSFLARCAQLGVEVEHELHAMSDLLPRPLYDDNPEMFRMDEDGNRVREDNLCVHSQEALEVAAQRVVHFSQLLPSTTGRYFYWPDDGRPMCRCPQCKGFSDSDQALLLENHLLAALRRVDHSATLAHIAYLNTLQAPTQVKPEPGVFLEFAPISRQYDRPLRSQGLGLPDREDHARLRDCLDANLEVFGTDGAQALEYWLDVSRFSGWKREATQALQWDQDVYLDDLELYAARGIRHITTFATWIDADYVERFGEPPLRQYGYGLLGYRG